MSVFVQRTVNLIGPTSDQRFGQDGLLLQDFDNDLGYVLLGEPGMGKSTEFKAAAHKISGARCISVRRFIRPDFDTPSDFPSTTIFIDGLDEMRVGGGDPRAVLDKVINGIEALGTPQFRLSCRPGNWLGSRDREELNSLVEPKEIPILQLNPLSYDDIREIVSHRGQDANTFIQRAHEYGIDALLGNPQLLFFLITSLEAGGWPGSQLIMLENACRELVRERNPEHRDANSSSLLYSREAILTAAGKLSVCMLVANKTGWTRYDSDDPEILSLLDLECHSDLPFQAALDSRIFEGSSSSKFPLHRIVAEFLGARYLNKEIQNGLSARRALAILMGHNGTLLPDLRGLAAWLAALNRQARATLIRIDPSTVAFNGDISRFSSNERKKLLVKLEQQIHLTSDWPSASALTALSGSKGIPIIQDLTESPTRSKNRQALVYLLLQGFTPVYHAFTSESDWETDHKSLLEIVCDHSWQSNVRCEALGVLNRVLHNIPERNTVLRNILHKLKEHGVSDEKHDLRGTLLNLIYPDELRPAEIWNYLATGPAIDHHGRYQNFFSILVDRSNEEQIKELLDSLCDHASEAIPKLEAHKLSDLVIQILARGIELFGDKLHVPELYRWFELVEFDYYSSQLIPVHASRPRSTRHDKSSTVIRNWLIQRNTVQYALIEHGLCRKKSKIGTESLFKAVALKFVGTRAPVGFRSWCLGRAVQLWSSNQTVAKELASWSVQVQEGWELPPSDEEIATAVSDISGLIQWNDVRLKSRAQSEIAMAEVKRKQKEIQDIHQQEKQEKLDFLRQQQANLAKGQCRPVILDELAQVYFDDPNTDKDTPQTCLKTYFDGDENLVYATLAGFCSLVDRDDLPDLDQISQLYENGRRSFFALPFLAGMEEVYKASNDLSHLSESVIRRALGFYLITDPPRQQPFSIDHSDQYKEFPTWYQQTLQYYPEAVADSLVSVHNASVRSKNLPNARLYEMAFDPAYSHVAKIAVPRMFTVFPTRCSARQLESLRLILWSSILNSGMSAVALQAIVSRRLNRKHMNISQQALWLGAGLFSDRNIYSPKLINFLSTGEASRVRHVIDFLVPTGHEPIVVHNIATWTAHDISQMIQTFGRLIQPPVFREHAGLVSDEQRISRKFHLLFTHWIKELTKRTCDDARKNLDLLASDTSLSAWKWEIVLAQREQARHRRAARHSDLSLEQILETLDNGLPSNAADLVSLTVDALEKLAESIRNGPASAWRHYWDWGQNPRIPLNPKPENDCRDVLLSGLEIIFERNQVNVLPEVHHTDYRRADLQISFGSNLAIPIEIKKNSAVDIWSGITTQLVPKYTRDPKSDGYGIYLVFWFGAEKKYMRVVSPDGGIPQEPLELKKLLERQLDAELRNRIHIVIIDVSLAEKFMEEESIIK